MKKVTLADFIKTAEHTEIINPAEMDCFFLRSENRLFTKTLRFHNGQEHTNGGFNIELNAPFIAANPQSGEEQICFIYDADRGTAAPSAQSIYSQAFRQLMGITDLQSQQRATAILIDGDKDHVMLIERGDKIAVFPTGLQNEFAITLIDQDDFLKNYRHYGRDISFVQPSENWIADIDRHAIGDTPINTSIPAIEEHQGWDDRAKKEHIGILASMQREIFVACYLSNLKDAYAGGARFNDMERIFRHMTESKALPPSAPQFKDIPADILENEKIYTAAIAFRDVFNERAEKGLLTPELIEDSHNWARSLIKAGEGTGNTERLDPIKSISYALQNRISARDDLFNVYGAGSPRLSSALKKAFTHAVNECYDGAYRDQMIAKAKEGGKDGISEMMFAINRIACKKRMGLDVPEEDRLALKQHMKNKNGPAAP